MGYDSSQIYHIEMQKLVQEYVVLNRRRLESDGDFDAASRARWLELRTRLERALGDGPPLGGPNPRPRSSLRVPSRVAVRVSNGGDSTWAMSQNLSENGLFVAMRGPLSPGTWLRLEIEGGPGLPPIQTQAVVVWSRQAEEVDAPAGMAVRFESLGRAERAALAGQIEGALQVL